MQIAHVIVKYKYYFILVKRKCKKCPCKIIWLSWTFLGFAFSKDELIRLVYYCVLSKFRTLLCDLDTGFTGPFNVNISFKIYLFAKVNRTIACFEWPTAIFQLHGINWHTPMALAYELRQRCIYDDILLHKYCM